MWQPIETAPKDGTHILLTGGRTTESFYCDDYERHERRPVVSFWSDRPAWKHGGSCGNWVISYWDDDWRDGYENPTHWMPLPEPPQP